MEKSVFTKEMIFIDPAINRLDRKTIIRYLCNKLIKRGFITEAYINEVIAREKLHPTGLPTKPYGSAVPHANPIGVNETGIALAVLRTPISFFCMDNPKKEVDVYLVFLMSFLNGNQVAMLQWISNVLSDQQIVKQIAESVSPNQVFEIIEPFLNNNSKGAK